MHDQRHNVSPSGLKVELAQRLEQAVKSKAIPMEAVVRVHYRRDFLRIHVTARGDPRVAREGRHSETDAKGASRTTVGSYLHVTSASTGGEQSVLNGGV